MEREKENFADWLIEMLEKHKISQSELARETKINKTYICKIICKKMSATGKIKYMIINFFKQNGETDCPLNELEEAIPTTYGEWLSLETSKNNISSEELSKETGINAKLIRDIWLERTISTIDRKLKILECLEKIYGIDISKGKELLERTISVEREQYSIWINNGMKELGISNIEFAKYLRITPASFSKIRKGRIVPSPEKAELIFCFFEKYGIDTSNGRKLFKKLHQGSIKWTNKNS